VYSRPKLATAFKAALGELGKKRNMGDAADRIEA
jgi:hypothetical protein